MQYSQFDTTIGGEKHTVVVIDPEDDGSPKIPQRIHRVVVLDRSGSMSEARKLDQACDRAAEFNKGLRSGDLYSLFWFSGQGQYAPILIGAKPNDDVSKIIDRYRYTVGLTVFSEVMQTMVPAINDHKDLVDQTVVDVLTDGSAVPNSWSVETEERRAFTAAEELVKAGVSAINTIGFGPYYNAEFLRNLSSLTESGEFVHTSKMADFAATFEQNTMAARGMTKRSLSVDAPGATILHVGTDSLSNSNSELHLTRLAQDGNTLYIVLGKSKDVEINGEAIDLKKVAKGVDDGEKEKFFYAYANYLYYSGERRKAIDVIVNNLHDRHLADLTTNAYTPDEIGVAQADIRRAALYPHARMVGGRTGPGYLPARNAVCVMDVFAILFDTLKPAFYVPYSKNVQGYERTGRKAQSAENRFTPDYSEEIRSPVTDIVWNEERPNLSLRFTTPGTVQLMATAAKKAGLPETVKSFIWRNHTFVVDGNVNVPAAEFLVPKETMMKLVAKKVPLDNLGPNTLTVDGVTEEYTRVIIQFKKLPVLNREYAEANPTPDEILRIVRRQTELEAQLKVANHFLKDVKEKNVEARADGFYAGMGEKQIEVLEEHGIRKDGSYGGIAPSVAKAADSDFYEARSMKFALAGYATMPSVNDFLAWVGLAEDKPDEKASANSDPAPEPKAKGKKASADSSKKKTKTINAPGRLMVEYYNDVLKPKMDAAANPVELRDVLKKEIAVLKAEQSTVDTQLNVVKIGKVLTNDGFQGFKPGAKGNEVYEAGDGTVLNLQAKRVKVYIDRPAEDIEAEAANENQSATAAVA